jgi:hypothetical protein
VSKRYVLGITVLMLGLLVVGCGRAPAGVYLQPESPVDPTASLTPARLDLVVLHTNDNWGETEPCG